jgi:hypothetical protein
VRRLSPTLDLICAFLTMFYSSEPVARPFFRALFAVLTIAIAAILLVEGVHLLLSDAPAPLSCSGRRRALCELGVWILRSFVPPTAHSMVIGIVDCLGSVFMGWLTWLILFRSFRNQRK